MGAVNVKAVQEMERPWAECFEGSAALEALAEKRPPMTRSSRART
jgi:hypothetical protein